MVLELGLSVGVGGFPLRQVVAGFALWLDVAAWFGVGSRLGDMAQKWQCDRQPEATDLTTVDRMPAAMATVAATVAGMAVVITEWFGQQGLIAPLLA